MFKDQFLEVQPTVSISRLATLKTSTNLKIHTFYSVDIEADKICQIKKKKDMLDSENQKQSLTDAFE